MELTKEDIVKLIKSNPAVSLQEMARGTEEESLKQKAKSRPITQWNKVGEEDFQVTLKDISKSQAVKNKEIEYNVVGWTLNDRQNIIYTCESEIEDWIIRNESLYGKIKELFGTNKIHFSKLSCPRTVHRKPAHRISPPPGAEYGPEMTLSTEPASRTGIRPKYSEEDEPVSKTSYDQKTWILRGGRKGPGINDLIKQYLENSEVNEKLSRLSVPAIRVEDRERRNLGEFRSGKISNNSIDYTIHSFNGYETLDEFRDILRKKLRGTLNVKEQNKIEYHLARQYNEVYRNWEDTIKNEKDYSGKTLVYKIDKFGMEQKNLDVTIQSILNIRGTKGENSYTWTVTFKTNFGKKENQQFTIEGGLQPDQEIISTKTVNLPEDIVFDDDNPIIFNDEIVGALKSALDDVKGKIMSIPPISRLKLATPTQGELDVKAS